MCSSVCLIYRLNELGAFKISFVLHTALKQLAGSLCQAYMCTKPVISANFVIYGLDNILKSGAKNLNIEKIIFKVVHVKFLAMHININN